MASATHHAAIGIGGGTDIGKIILTTSSINVASVAANTSVEQTFTVAGLAVGDFVSVCKPSVSAGLVVGNCRVSATDTLAITFGNHTASPIDPAAETYVIFGVRVAT